MLGGKIRVCQDQSRRKTAVGAPGICLKDLPRAVSDLDAGAAVSAYRRLEDGTGHQIASGRDAGRGGLALGRLPLHLRGLLGRVPGLCLRLLRRRGCSLPLRGRLSALLAGTVTGIGGLAPGVMALFVLFAGVAFFLLERLHPLIMDSIQSGALVIADHIPFSPRLNRNPFLRHAVEIPADAPLNRGPLHTVAEAALDRFNIAVIGPVPFGDPRLLGRKIDGNAAQLGALAFPRHKIIVPAVDAHCAVQPGLDGSVGHIGHCQAAGLC